MKVNFEFEVIDKKTRALANMEEIASDEEWAKSTYCPGCRAKVVK